MSSRFSDQGELASALLDCECIKFGEYSLKNGLSTPVVVDMGSLGSVNHDSIVSVEKQFSSRGVVLDYYIHMLNSMKRHFDHVMAIPESSFTNVGMIASRGQYSALQMRVNPKTHTVSDDIKGSYRRVATNDQTPQNVVLIDDVITDGQSKLDALEKVKRASSGLLDVSGIVVMIDRQIGGSEKVTEAGLEFRAAISLLDVIKVLEADARITKRQASEVYDWYNKYGV